MVVARRNRDGLSPCLSTCHGRAGPQAPYARAGDDFLPEHMQLPHVLPLRESAAEDGDMNRDLLESSHPRKLSYGRGPFQNKGAGDKPSIAVATTTTQSSGSLCDAARPSASLFGEWG